MDISAVIGAYGKELIYALFNMASVSLLTALIASTRDPSRGARWLVNLMVRWGLAELALLIAVFSGMAVKELVADVLRIVFPYWVALRSDALTVATVVTGILAIGKMGSALLLNAVFETAAPAAKPSRSASSKTVDREATRE